MSQTPREKAELAARRREVSKLYLQRYNQEEIAERLGISQPTVSRDVKFLTDQWKKDSEITIQETIARELADLNYMELEAALNYEASKPGEGDPGRPLSRQLEKWAIIRLKIKERRARLLGLDQPQKVNLEGGGYSDSPVIFYLPDNGRDPDLIGPGKV